MSKVVAPFPEKLAFLFKPKRNKVAHGGRGSGKSWGFARALLILGIKKKLRILCAREVQESIKDSVHKLLKDQIEAMGFGSEYRVLNDEIRGANGTEFLFTGLLEHTVDSIKSFEGCDICWVEEAQSVSEKSWQMLIPTIRKDGSEIWVSMNPALDTDPTYKRFLERADEDSIVVQMNWRDNPWFNDVLNKERLRDKASLPEEDYLNIWEGKARSSVQGAIYSDEIQRLYQMGRVMDLPADPRLKTHVVLDLGWNDSMFAILVQRHLSSLRVVGDLCVDHKTYAWLSTELRKLHPNANWGRMFLPHDGNHGNAFTGMTAKQTMTSMGWRTAIVPNLPVETGIRQGRMALGQTYVDRGCTELLESLKRYRRHVNSKTNEDGTPIHDAYSHGADAWRYTALVAPQMTNEDDEIEIPSGQIASYGVDAEMGL